MVQPERDLNLLAMGGAGTACGTESRRNRRDDVELAFFLADKGGFSKLATTRDYVDVPDTAVVGNAEKIKKQPDTVKRFMRTSLRAIRHIRDNRADTTQLLAPEFSMDQEIAGLAYKQLLDLLRPDGRNR